MAMVLLGRFPRVEGEELRLALLASGLEVEVRGEARAPLEGMLPAGDVGLELWVEEALLARAQGVQKDVERERPAPASAEPRSRPSVFAVLFFLTSVVLAFLLWRERHPAQAIGPITWSDEPGSPCTTGKYQGHIFQRSCDRNGDGNWEQVDQFDRRGKLQTSSLDTDEDGFPDQTTSFDVEGRAVARSLDLDHDWRTDRIDSFDRRDRNVSSAFDDDHDGRNDRHLQRDSTGATAVVTTWRGDDWDMVYLFDGGTVTERMRGDLHELLVGDGGVPQVLTAEGWR